MTAVAVVGSQWGDEGKGKITDFLSKDAAVAVRSNGGNNAGHTIDINGQTFKMRLIPSGIFAAKDNTVIGNGVVINPEVMFGELENLEKSGIDTSGLRISNRAHIIMPYDIKQDEYQEEAKGLTRLVLLRMVLDQLTWTRLQELESAFVICLKKTPLKKNCVLTLK